MSIEPGQQLLHYRLTEPLGAGGMGVVWKATDTTLGRDVAIKILPDAFADDAERRTRFEREARVLASLNHPGIAAIYGLHQDQGTHFLAMEFVEGQDLSQRIGATGALPLDIALDVAGQIADALAAAHDNGVVHRDLKPANVVLTTEGKIKVLDFGLAKALTGDPSSSGFEATMSPTVTSAGTVAGVILGTAAYMSPEQARGRAVDRRADIWAFGCLLYEMLTGKTLFGEETISDTLAAVLRSEPDMDALPGNTPASIRRLIARCLTKDPEQRLAHIAGGRLEIRDAILGTDDVVTAGPSGGVAATSTATRMRWLPWVAFAVSMLLLVTVLLTRGGDASSVAAEPLNLSIDLPTGAYLPTSSQMSSITMARDGSKLAIVLDSEGQSSLYLRRMDAPDFVKMPDTVGATSPAFSPDGQSLAFFQGGALKTIAVDGSRAIKVADAPGGNRGSTWANDSIIYAPHYTSALMQVHPSGGTPTPLTELDEAAGERTHRWPQAIPGKDLVLYTVGMIDSPESYDTARIDAVRPSTGERRSILEGASFARYVASGHLLFARGGFLLAVAFDPETLETRGTPVVVMESVRGVLGSGVAHTVFSDNGLMAYVRGAESEVQYSLTWRYEDGKSEPLPLPARRYGRFEFSPDRTRIAVEVSGDAVFNIWVYDLRTQAFNRLTFDGDNTMPVWSPDGKKIAFASTRSGAMATYTKNADGTGDATLVTSPSDYADCGMTVPSGWSPDGSTLAIAMSDRDASNIYLLSLADGSPATPFLATRDAELHGVFSPDGRFMAYVSTESGRDEIYVREYPGPGGKWQISSGGGRQPLWSEDGSALYYGNGRELYRVRLDVDGGFRSLSTETIYENVPDLGTGEGRIYGIDIAANRRFLLAEPETDNTTRSVSVIVNWFDELRRKVPAE